jgi:16S rRNA (cytidine1402-2'-O)-methyltransferase
MSGFPADRFLFLGFLPHKKGRETLYQRIADAEETVVLYESPHRILRTLTSLSGMIPNKQVAVCRELTKIHESVVRGSFAEAIKHFTDHPDQVRGEVVLVISAQ